MSGPERYFIKNLVLMIKYGIVGVLNTCVGFGAFLLFYRVFCVQYIISNTISYAFGLSCSFILNKLWTFESKGTGKIEAVLFISVFILCFFIQSGLLIYLKEVIRMDVVPAQIISMIVYTILGFILNKTVTFNKKLAAVHVRGGKRRD
jgi:putative flippase GtrA